MVILQRTTDVKRMPDVRKRLAWRMRMWEKEEFEALVQDTEQSLKSSLSCARGTSTPEHRARVFDTKVKRGKLRAAVRYITDREGGGIMTPDDIDDKSGLSVIDALKEKHPKMRDPGPAAMPAYDELPAFVDLDITADTVRAVAEKMSGGAGLGGIDACALKLMLLQHGGASQALRSSAAKFASWLSNSHPPWAAYRAFQWSRLVALAKNPGIRPIGIGDIWRRLFAKCNLQASGEAAKLACGSDQLCAGLSAGIEGGIHGMNQLWKENEGLHNFGFLLVDARNAFNEVNRIALL